MSNELVTGDTPENRHKSGFRGPSPDVGKATQFKPGECANPGGRPKRKPITEMFEQMLEKQEDAADIREAIRKVFFQKSGIAKIMLLEKMAERLEGKVTQPVELNGELALSISERMRKARERNSGS